VCKRWKLGGEKIEGKKVGSWEAIRHGGVEAQRRRSAVFWRAERIILNFYCLILNSKLKIQNYQLNQPINDPNALNHLNEHNEHNEHNDPNALNDQNQPNDSLS
jgi:hypothetical protein